MAEAIENPGVPSAAPRMPFPESLELTPVSRWPTILPEATVRTVLAQPYADGCACAKPPRDPRASIVVVTFNNLVFNKLCLESLLHGTEQFDFELMVVDNGSTDGTREYLQSLPGRFGNVRLLLNASNRGFAAANNQGLKLARGGLLVLLNNDTIPAPGWLSGLARWLEQSDVGLVGPVTNRAGNESQIDVTYRTYGELLRFASRYTAAHLGELFELRVLTMFCVALRREVYEQVGELDERFELGLFEDDDYCLRVRASGKRVVCAEDVFVHHFGQATLGKLAAGGAYGELFHANRRRWEQKWGRPWEPYQRRRNDLYESQLEQLREIVCSRLPLDATLIIVSKGDPCLLDMGGRTAWHFPRAPDGQYAGYLPAGSNEAIEHLEELRSHGGRFLVIPGTELWWLEFYADFRRHLEQRYHLASHTEGIGSIYALD